MRTLVVEEGVCVHLQHVPFHAQRAVAWAGLVSFAVVAALAGGVAAGALGRGSVDARADDGAHHLVLANHSLLTLARGFTYLGAPIVVDALAVAAAIALWAARERRAAVFVVTVRVAAQAIASVLKLIVARHRPLFVHPVAHASGYSFPSGHSTGAASVYLPLAVVVCQRSLAGAARVAASVLAVLICLAVATTRVLLGLHYPSDVIAGLLLAVGVMAATAVLMQRIESRVASRSARP